MTTPVHDDEPVIHLDHNATTPVDTVVLEAMLPCFRELIGNASSQQHLPGRRARRMIEHAREQAASLIGADPREIIWTSGATEANNTAILGLARFWAGQPEDRRRHLVVSSIEHPSVMEACEELKREGFEVTQVDPDAGGVIRADAVAAALRETTLMACVMWANNETGVINEIEAIGRLCRMRNIHFMCDATQAVGKTPVDVNAAGVDLLTWSAHKHHGPQGVGALYLRRREPRVRIRPLLVGGGQERGRRSGTSNLAGIVGMGMACQRSMMLMSDEGPRVAALRDHLEAAILSSIPSTIVNGDKRCRLPQTSNISFTGLDAQRLMAAMPRLAVSSGSACSSESIESSRVLRCMGVSADRARSAIRFSLGRETTRDEIEQAIAIVIEAARIIRETPADAKASC